MTRPGFDPNLNRVQRARVPHRATGDAQAVQPDDVPRQQPFMGALRRSVPMRTRTLTTNPANPDRRSAVLWCDYNKCAEQWYRFGDFYFTSMGGLEAGAQSHCHQNIHPVPGDTVLHLAVRCGRLGMARRLLACGADPQLSNSRGETPRALMPPNSEDCLTPPNRNSNLNPQPRNGMRCLLISPTLSL